MIHELNQEGNVTLTCMIARAEIGRTAKNTPYLTLALQDASGTLDSRYWNLSEEEAKAWKEGMVVEARGELKRYRNAWQMRVFSLKQTDGDPVDFVPNAPVSREKMADEIAGMIDAMDNEVIRQVTKTLLDEYGKEFFSYPAAVRNHHNYPGGLAWHSLSMARMALHIIDQYGWLDRDLLVSGVLLHDLAKIFEYTQPVLPEYTIEGNLVGHISMGTQLIDRAAVSLGVEQSEEVMLMKHMLLSHHGKYEYGSPVLPMIPEAEVLTLLDNLDSRLFMIENMIEQVAPGCFGPRNFALDNRMFYRKSWNNENGHPVPVPVSEPEAEENAKEQETGATSAADSNPEPDQANPEKEETEEKEGVSKKEEKPDANRLQKDKPAEKNDRPSSEPAAQSASDPERTKQASSRHPAHEQPENKGTGRRAQQNPERNPADDRRRVNRPAEEHKNRSSNRNERDPRRRQDRHEKNRNEPERTPGGSRTWTF